MQRDATYRVFNLHGPTVFESDAIGLDALTDAMVSRSVSDGFPLRIVHIPSDTVVVWIERGKVVYNLVRAGSGYAA